MAAKSASAQRAGRQEELRRRLKETTDRYEAVFGRELQLPELKEYIEHAAKQDRYRFLHQRLGDLSEVDCKYLMDLLGAVEAPKGRGRPAAQKPAFDDEDEDEEDSDADEE